MKNRDNNIVDSLDSDTNIELAELEKVVGGAAAMMQNLAASLGSIATMEDQKNAIRNEVEQLRQSGSGSAGYAEKMAGLTSQLDALSGQQQKYITRSSQEQLALQQLMTTYNQASSLASNLLADYSKTMENIAGNIR